VNRINFAISATPIVSVAAGENVAVDTIAYDMQKTLGASGNVSSGETSPSVTIDYSTTAGYNSNVVAYQNVNNSSAVTILPDLSIYDFIIIKHTGCLYSSATELGATTTMAIDIYIGTQIIGCIRPNEGLLLPLRGKVSAALKAALQTGTTGVALEIFGTS